MGNLKHLVCLVGVLMFHYGILSNKLNLCNEYFLGN